MTNSLAPRVTLDVEGRRPVTPTEPFTFAVSVKNESEVVDAFDVSVLGVDPNDVNVFNDGVPLPLFPDAERQVEVVVTLGSGFPAGRQTLWIKASSRTERSAFAITALEIDVAAKPVASLVLNPGAATGGRNARFGLTVRNDGNSPLDLDFAALDDENRLSVEFVPEGVRELPIGATRSVQVVAAGPRPFSGAATTTQFTVIARRGGDSFAEIGGTVTQRPLVPQLALVFAGVVLLLGVWALIVGAAIDAVVEDANDDLAESFENGMSAVVDKIDDQGDVLEDARQQTIAVAPGGAAADQTDTDTLTGSGRGLTGGASNFSGVGSGSAHGLSGRAVNVTLQADGTAPAAPMIPPDAIIGTIVAESDGRPVPGAKVTLQAILPGSDPAAADPNRDPLTVAADDQGLFSAFKLLPGSYTMSIASPGFQNRVCSGVAIPRAGRPDCGTGLQSVGAAESWKLGLLGQQATIAGVVTGEDGNPLIGATLTIRRIGEPNPTGVMPPITPVPVSTIDAQPDPVDDIVTFVETDDGQFSFTPDPATVPGIFELTARFDGFTERGEPLVLATKRLVVTLEGGTNVIGQVISLSQIPPTMTTEPEPVSTLTGTVTQAGTGIPLANVIVTVTDADGPTQLVTATGPDGSYTLGGMKAGRYNVLFSLDGYRSDAKVVPLAATGTADGVLSGGARVRGTVTDSSTGLPIGGINVAIGDFSATTDDIGGFDVPTLAPGTYTATFTSGGDYRQATATVVFDGGETRIISVALTPTGSLPGIVSSFGQTVPGATVTVVGRASGRTVTSTTAADGRFRFDQMSPELYDVRVAARGYTSVALQGVQARGAPLEAGLVPEGVISGTVTSLTRTVTVQLSRPGFEASTTVDGAGFYTFPQLHPGLYQVTFTYTNVSTDPPVDPPPIQTKTIAVDVSAPTIIDITFP